MVCRLVTYSPAGWERTCVSGEAGEDGAGVGFDVAVPAGGRGIECLLGHDACAGVVIVLVAVGEQRGPGGAGVCDEEWGSDVFLARRARRAIWAGSRRVLVRVCAVNRRGRRGA
jgi:hypothetical protein